MLQEVECANNYNCVYFFVKMREIHSMLFNKDMKMKEIWEIMRKYNVKPVRKMNVSEKYLRFWINNPTKNFRSEKNDFGVIVYQDKLDDEKNDEKHEKKREIQAMLFKKDMNKWQISEVLWWFKGARGAYYR